ncbi:MAG: DUF4031 domain-containing protein [Eubacteriales bacterium]|nr:DUF4031 domain-containing protein [Eubacteriales bacterium]
MIYLDTKGHLMSDQSIDELHAFAQDIGLRREWFQDKVIPHYDLTSERMRTKAQAAGARLVTERDTVRLWRSPGTCFVCGSPGGTFGPGRHVWLCHQCDYEDYWRNKAQVEIGREYVAEIRAQGGAMNG